MNKSPAYEEFSAAVAPDDIWRAQNHETLTLGLAWLRGLLGDYVSNLRAGKPASEDREGATPVMTDLDADWLLRSDSARFTAGEQTLAAQSAYQDAREAMRTGGAPAAIDELSAMFSLSRFEEDVILLAVAAHFDAAFPALFGYAHDRLSLDYPTPHLAIALLTPGDPDAVRLARDLLSPAARLRQHHLVQCAADSAGALSALAADEVLSDFLDGNPGSDHRIRHILKAVPAGPCPKSVLENADRFLEQLRAEQSATAMIIGPRRSGRRSIAAMIAAKSGQGIQEALIARLPPPGPERIRALQLITRDSALRGVAVLVDLSDIGEGLTAAGRAEMDALAAEILAEIRTRLIVIADRRPDVPGHLPILRTSSLNEADRAEIWRTVLPGSRSETAASAATLASHFQLGPSEIAAICAEVAGTLDGTDIWCSCRDAASRGLDAMAERIAPRFSWNDIVLPDDITGDLRAIAAQVRHRAAVYGDGGFDRKLVRGRGVSAMFAGPSGVGKTMAAEVIAGELDLNLYRIDLSQVISKYIGETEQNLRRVFDAAEAGGAVLFFDEADALFGKRSEVKDSHDRYANIEISYLLQRMETYSGLAILATNLKSHIDTAFLRRLRFVIDLPFPDASLRERIWACAFPGETRTDNIDFRALGRLEVAGGNIVVIAVNAAFLAAGEGVPVSMDHIGRAARAEMRKLDKEFRPSWQFGAAQ